MAGAYRRRRAAPYRRPSLTPYKASGGGAGGDPPLTRGGRSIFDDPEAFRLRFVLSQVLGPPVALRGPKARYAPAAQRAKRGGK